MSESEPSDSGTEPSVAVPSERESVELSTAGAVTLGIAAILVVIATVFVAVPGLSPTLDLTVVIELLMALFALGAALTFAVRYLRGDHTAVDPPLIEYRSTISVPGESLDADLLGARSDGDGDSYRKLRDVRDRLEDLLEQALGRTGVPADETEETVQSGSWTDDRLAASFFTTGRAFSTVDQVRHRVARARPRAIQARHAIDAIADRLSITDRVWTDPDESGDISTIEEGWVGRFDEVELRDRETNRWALVGALTLSVVGIGVLLRAPALVLAAVPGAGLVAYRYLGSAPTPALVVEREIDETDPHPGEEVTVTVTVTNAGDGMVFDLRLLDGVPPGLRVVDGSPRHGTTLQPGAKTRFAYVLEADRGEHRFESSLVVTRDPSGGIERTATADAEGEQFLRCEPRPTQELSVPVRTQTSRDVGRVVTDSGGSGLEFHSVREYRSGDPLKRIDWNRAARGGGMATLQFREEHAATVVLLIDARDEAFVAPGREAPSALERSLGAAAEVFHSRLDSDDRVGLAALAADDCWLAPGAGHGHWPLARRLLTTDSAFTERGGGKRFYPLVALRRLRKKLPKNAQLVLFSPLCDDTAVWMARRLHAYGYPMTVVSSDPTTTVSPGRTTAHMERQLRLSRLRQADVRVIDWDHDEPLEAATSRATRRWSR
jgi:uncharacterized repeat protein (TIGR01451 family)